jgi:hypothetical protein
LASRVAVADGPFSTATTWGQVTNTETIHATTNITPTTGSFTATFTAPGLLNSCLGVLMYVATKPVSPYTYTVTLQENSVDTIAAVTVDSNNFPPAGNWIFFKFTTPYLFTSLTAGYYRFKVVRNGASGTSAIFAADAAGTAIAFITPDDRTSVPAATENIYVVGANGTGTVSITMDGTQACGAGTDTVLAIQRTVGNGITVAGNGLLNWDIVASATLTCKGNVIVSDGGEIRMGTVAVPYPAARLARLAFEENGVTTNYGMVLFGTAKRTLVGSPKSSTLLYKTKYASGVGTAADPLIVADNVAWSVNDEIVIYATSDNATNYNEAETRFVKTVVGPNSYVISTTKGGGEAALTYTHTTEAWVLNVERNVLIDTTNTVYGFYSVNNVTTAGNVTTKWVRIETFGSATAGKFGYYVSTTSQESIDYVVFYRGLSQYGFYFSSASTTSIYTGNIICNSSTTINFNASANKSFNDLFIVKCVGAGMGYVGGSLSNLTFNGLYINALTGGITTNGLTMAGNKLNFSNVEINACRGNGINTIGSMVDTVFTNLLCGTKGKNGTAQYDISLGAIYNNILFDNCSFGSNNFITGYLLLALGSEIKFNKLQQTDNNHFWYTNYGSARSAGATLTDTIVRTPGSLAVVLRPESLTGFTWSFNIFAKANSSVNFLGYFMKNAAFSTDVARVELWLPGSTVADATFTLADNTNWQMCSLAANYASAINGLATIKVIGLTATASAYLYCDDFYNSGNTVTSTDPVTGLDTWYQGKPVSILSPSSTVGNILANLLSTNNKIIDENGKYSLIV